ncbi:DUF3540 domain-containing protein [Sorangium sp. So ce394]|uniref:DUF3540 domain-containing protein n=1 Tax=Sorangium cellulosum TaxID=56 RepID=A0A150RSC6_SORCE|nr:hypothetical protein BE18_12935 [Sorangium cellulosum]
MQNLARKLESTETFQETGRVVGAGAGGFVVRAGTGEHEAQRAVSCLVEPEVGDVVLLARSERGKSYVLAVLERAPGAAARVVHDGDIELQLRRGRFRVAAQEGIDLASGKDVSVASAGVRVNTVEGNVVFQRLSCFGAAVHAEVEKAKMVFTSLETVAERLTQKLKRSYRLIEQFDHVRADRIDYAAKQTASLRGENTLVTAEELVKLDGEQIHLG